MSTLTDDKSRLPTSEDDAQGGSARDRLAEAVRRRLPRGTMDREDILAAAAGCLRELGYDRLNIRRIAESLGCSVGTIYNYFSDKRDLLNAMTQRAMAPAAVAAEAGLSLEQAVRAYHRCAAQEEQAYRLMFWLHMVTRQIERREHAHDDSANPLPKPQPTAPGHCHGDNHPADGAPAGPPPVVQRVVIGWTQMLDDVKAATLAWAAVHGAVLFGLDEDQAWRQVQAALTGHDDDEDHSDNAQPSRPGKRHDVDDVCLL